jgi:signal transduction histidine kinase
MTQAPTPPRRRLEQANALQFRVTRILAGSTTLDDAAPRVLAAIGESFGWSAGVLWVADRSAGVLRALAGWTEPGSAASEFVEESRRRTFAPGEGLPGATWASRLPHALPDMSQETALARHAAALRTGLHAAVTSPITAGDEVIGVIEFFSAEVLRPDPAPLATLTDLGSQIGQFVQHRLAEQELHRRVHELEVLQRAAHALSASLQLEVVLDAVARSAAEALDAPRATVLRRDGDELVIVGEYDETGTSARGRRWPVEDLPGAEQVLRGEFWTGQLEHVGPALQEVTAATMVTAVAMAPVRSGTEMFGILALLSRTPRVVTQPEMRLLHGIASLAGLAVGNAESFRLEREHGRRMAALETAKAQFLNLASHELRSPLTVLRGYMSMIAEGSLGPVPERMARVLPLLTDKLAQMSSLIDEMLETARLEDSRLQLETGAVDLRLVTAAAVRAVEASTHPGQRIRLELADRPAIVDADAGRLEAAVRNLVDNAVKYSPGGADVECSVQVVDTRAVVRVRDRGLGIAPQDMEKLFTRFGRIVTAENSHIPGTGLGLYLAREMIRMQGGDIEAESVAGAGSVFTLWLPLRDD